MANPTTNYGWPMPTSTDLVTDLPADFAAFGQPVDTSLKALNPETTLGDIAYRSATANTNTRLGIGTTNQVLSVVGGVPAWATISAGGMTEIASSTTTGVSTITFSSIPATYKHLLITWQDLYGSLDDQTIQVRVNGVTSGYTFFNFGANGSTIMTGNTQSSSSIQIQNIVTSTSSATDLTRLTGWIYNYAQTGYNRPFNFIASGWLAAANPARSRVVNGSFGNTADAISSLTLLLSGGTISGGKITLYGVS